MRFMDELFLTKDAWCHQMKLKRQGYGQITVILAVNIPICVRYMNNKKSLASKRSICF